MTKVQRYKVGYYTDEWGMSSNTPCLVPDDNGYAVRFEDYCKLEAELAALKAENEWQPIETAPKDEFVLLAGPSGYTTIETVFTTGRMCSDYHAGRRIDHANDDLTDWGFIPTHWMPLPKPPAIDAAMGDK